MASKGKKKSSSQKQTKKANLPLDRLEPLLKMMEEHQLAHLEWEEGGTYVCLKTDSCFANPVATAERASSRSVTDSVSTMMPQNQSPSAASPSGNSKPASNGNGGGGVSNSNQVEVLAPLVGTFYRAPSPNASPYKSQGDSVSRGDTICIIEAMKLMNEIESEYSGRVVAVLAEDGQPVEYGEPIFVIEKS